MEQFVGLDVSQKLTHVCVVDREGKALWRGSSSTTPEDIAAAVRAHALGAVRIGFETGALSTWLWHGLKKIGCSFQGTAFLLRIDPLKRHLVAQIGPIGVGSWTV